MVFAVFVFLNFRTRTPSVYNFTNCGYYMTEPRIDKYSVAVFRNGMGTRSVSKVGSLSVAVYFGIHPKVTSILGFTNDLTTVLSLKSDTYFTCSDMYIYRFV